MVGHALFAILVGYLVGSIPTGLIVGQAFGVNVRSMGSGKTGATNVLRSAGWKAGLIVAFCDTLKGALPVILAYRVYATPQQVGNNWAVWIEAASGLAAIIGHNYPIYVGFKGGRGVATTAGMALALALPATLITVPFFFGVIALTRYVSIGSMLGSVMIPLIGLIFLLFRQDQLVSGRAGVLALAIASATIFITHRDNIHRLLSGTERKLGERARPTASSAG